MKKKLVLFSVLACTLIGSTVAYAGQANKMVKFNGANAYGSEFVTFVEGPLWYSDKVCYTLELIGPQNYCVTMPVKVATHSKTLVNSTLNYRMTRKKGTNVSAGYGNSSAYSQMKVNNKWYKVTATD